MSHFDWKLLRRKKVIPADRALPEKEDTWTSASEQPDACSFLGDVTDSKLKDVQQLDKTDVKAGADLSNAVQYDVDSGLPRSQETRKSKTKKVKNYLKKCKDALSKVDENVAEKKRQENCTSWYLEGNALNQLEDENVEHFEKYEELTEDGFCDDQDNVYCNLDDAESSSTYETAEMCSLASKPSIKSSEDALARLLEEDRRIDLEKGSKQSVYEDARDFSLDVCIPDESTTIKQSLDHAEKNGVIPAEISAMNDSNLNKCDSSGTLIAESAEVKTSVINSHVETVITNTEQDQHKAAVQSGEKDEAISLTLPLPGTRGDVASLVRNLLGPIYGEGVISLLIRQARDILVCAYHGNLESFVTSYLSPAAALLAELKCIASGTENEAVVPQGWPLTLGDGGLVLQLGELEASALRLGECYLCVRNAAATATALTKPIVASETVKRNTVEIALVWRATSMRAPGILGWDREDEFMDWRDPTQKVPETTLRDGESTGGSHSLESKIGRYRRRSREEIRMRSYESDHSSSSGGETSACNSINEHNCEQATSVDRLQDLSNNPSSTFQPARTRKIMKSRSASSVDTWKEDLEVDDDFMKSNGYENPRNNSSLFHEEMRAKVKRHTKVVSPTTMEKWKESSRYETKSRTLIPEDLLTPLRLDEVIVSDNRNAVCSKDLEERLRSVRHPDEVNDDDLPAYINTLLVTVERKIERVNIDDLTFPCPACRNIDTDDPLLGCRCVEYECNCDEEICDCRSSSVSSTKLQPSRTFEVAGIKHIDSDDEEEVRMGFGSKRKTNVITTPRTIHDIPEEVLMCGLTLARCTDAEGRPVFVYEHVSQKEILSPINIAPFLLYLARLSSQQHTQNAFTLFIRSESAECLEFIDHVLSLVTDQLNVTQALIQGKIIGEDAARSTLPLSNVKVIVVDDASLDKYVQRNEIYYDYKQWVIFYKEYDALMTEWHAAGRKLALEMSEFKECTSLSGTLTPLSRLLMDPTMRRTSRDAEEVINALEERAAALMDIDNVRLSVKRARRLVQEVGNAANRLESSFETRRATIRNLSILRTIEVQAQEILTWVCNKGEDVLSKHALHVATTLCAAQLYEREFEKFYFTSMRHLDKGSDLAEAAGASGLRELAKSLKQHLRGFGTRLEDRREYLEDTSRCCLLQDRAYEWAQEARAVGERKIQQFLIARPPPSAEHFGEMLALAEKLGNESLVEQCHVVRNRCTEALELARTFSVPSSPSRRQSYVFSNSSVLWNDNLPKRTSWDDNDSGASCVCPMDSMVSVGSGEQPLLNNITELRENAEHLLDCSPPRTPHGSPVPRRLSKPPVNSHLHRAPSIAPGMKVKKTILLIMREMIQTERDYVKSLEYIIENYIPELIRDDIPQALRGQRNVIFGNVEKIYEFHSVHFLHELEQCEQSPMMVGQCFLRHEKKFYLYALYNKNKPNSDSLMAEYGTAFFKQKQIELGDKMDLASYLLKPVQRMGKYALLLQQLVKAGIDLCERLSQKEEKNENGDAIKPIVEGEVDLRAAEQMVRFQLRHGNDLLAMDSLRDCDVNVKEQGRLLRQNEFLIWQGKGKKCLRQVFLFEDLILFSKARRFPDRKNLDIYIYKHSIKTTDIGLTAVIADSPTKFEIWFRKRKPGDTYTLQCASEDIKKAWTEELSNLLWKQALRNREVRLAEMSSMGIGNKPCLDIRPSADQINDRSISVAQLSKTPRFRNSIAVSTSDELNRSSRRPHSVISVSSSSSSGGSSGPPTTLNLGLDTSPRPHHRSTTLNSQCSVESGIIADISIVSDDSGDSAERSHWNSTLESPISHPTSSTQLHALTSVSVPSITSPSSSNSTVLSYDHDMSINL